MLVLEIISLILTFHVLLKAKLVFHNPCQSSRIVIIHISVITSLVFFNFSTIILRLLFDLKIIVIGSQTVNVKDFIPDLFKTINTVRRRIFIFSNATPKDTLVRKNIGILS